MAIVPSTFPPTPETAIASYSYTDVAEGTGLQIFYACNSQATTTKDYYLVGTVIASNDIQTDGASDLDFDTAPFNLPKTIKGTAYVSIPIYSDCTGGGGGDAITATVTVRLRHVTAGGSESEIASAVSETISATPIMKTVKKVLVKIIVPQTHFAKGEYLRISTDLVKGVVANGVGDVGIGHDPKARVTADFLGTGIYKVTTDFTAHIPFKLDL